MTMLDRAVKMLLPREDVFFDLLERGAACAEEAGVLIAKLCNVPHPERAKILEQLRDVEHKGDGVIHEVYDALNRTFVTPIDRADIFQLANNLEDIVDITHATAMQIIVHAMEDIPEGGPALAGKILEATAECKRAVGLLRNLKGLDRVREVTRRLSSLEHEGDDIYRGQLGRLFKEEKNAIRLIQHKEFLEGLERTLDCCDHVGTALNAIVLKNG